MAVEAANGFGAWEATAEVLMLDALPAILDQIYSNAAIRGVAIERISGKATADGVMLTATGHKT